VRRLLPLALPLLVVAACSSKPPPANAATQMPNLDGVPIEDVLTRVKQEVGLFYSDGARAEQNWPKLLSDLKVAPVCGNGHIAFEITSIKMDFAVVNDHTGKGGLGLKIPFGPAAAASSVGPGGSLSVEKAGTINLSYTYKPPATGPVSDDFEIIRKTAVILPALDHLRDALIKATGHRPCFQSLSKTDPDQTLTFTVEVNEDTTESLGFNFLVVDASASNENKNTGTNCMLCCRGIGNR
jgi:hypothetical protein